LTPWANYRRGQEVRGVLLYRRIPDDQAHWVREESRPTGYNFRPGNSQQHLSTQLADDPGKILAEYPDYGLLEIAADSFWMWDLRVTYEPEERPDHVAVWGLVGARKDVLRQLAASILRAWEPRTQRHVYSKPQPSSGR
jgi:hypothetical protein